MHSLSYCVIVFTLLFIDNYQRISMYHTYRLKRATLNSLANTLTLMILIKSFYPLINDIYKLDFQVDETAGPINQINKLTL